MARNLVKSIPTGAVPCSGPLMYDPNRFVTPGGDLFKIHPTSGSITKLTRIILKKKTLTPDDEKDNETSWYCSWGNAKKLVGDKIQPMQTIEGFYTGNDRVMMRALVAYYFVERRTEFSGMRAAIMDYDQPFCPENIRWVLKSAQDSIRARYNQTRSTHSPQVLLNGDEINWDEFMSWGHGFFINEDGSQVIKIKKNGTIKDVAIRVNSQGYKSASVRIDGTPSEVRINRMHESAKLGRALNPREIVDHLNRDTEDDSTSNLEVVTHVENVRRGKSAKPFIKVDPTTLKVVERHRCIQEFCEANNEFDMKRLGKRMWTGEVYKGFLWFSESGEGSFYTINKDEVVGEFKTIQERFNGARKSFEALIESGKITEEMIPIVDGIPCPTDAFRELIRDIDPLGPGDLPTLVSNHKNNKIANPCVHQISWFGTDRSSQIMLCMKSMMLFTRSSTNLRSRGCPFCNDSRTIKINESETKSEDVLKTKESETKTEDDTECVEGETDGESDDGGDESDGSSAEKQKMKFGHNDPWAQIPVYTYNSVRKTPNNPEPLKFIAKYETIADVIKNANGKLPKEPITKLKPIRYSVFQSNTGYFSKTTIPKRAKYKAWYVSFYPPNESGLMDETSPNWILQRRLSSPLFVFMREWINKQYTDEKASERAEYTAKKKAEKDAK